jgi:hypothetical protein
MYLIAMQTDKNRLFASAGCVGPLEMSLCTRAHRRNGTIPCCRTGIYGWARDRNRFARCICATYWAGAHVLYASASIDHKMQRDFMHMDTGVPFSFGFLKNLKPYIFLFLKIITLNI